MSPLAWVALAGTIAVLIVWRIERADQRARAERRRREAALLKVTELVVDFEHTPVRGASRDRMRPGKARRQARRG